MGVIVMKRILAVVIMVLVIGVESLLAAGSACTAVVEKVDGLRYVHWSWTSDDTTGSVTCTGKGSVLISGIILGVKFTPAASGTVPTDQYDVVGNNANGADVFMGVGADLTNNVALAGQWKTPENQSGGPVILYNETISPVVTNAGNSKTGTITLCIY